MLVNCDVCGREIEFNAPICVHCGATQQQRMNHFIIKAIPYCLLIIVGVFLSVYLTISETSDTIDRKPNVWCGEYSHNELSIYEDDISKGGSSICLSSLSWRSKVKMRINPYLTNGKSIENSDYNGKKVIVYGKIVKEESFAYRYEEIRAQSISIYSK